MATAVALVYQLIRVVLAGDGGSSFVTTVLNLTQLLFLFGVVLIYHWNVLRMDGVSTADSLAEKQGGYSLLIVDSGNGLVEAIKAALLKLGSRVQVAVANPENRPEGNFNALLLDGSLAVDAPDWIRAFDGQRIVVQNESKDIVWAEDASQAARSVQQLAEGEEIHKPKTGRSAWTIFVYVCAALFMVELIFFVLAFAISLVAR
jgi:hypothetical protein